MQIIFGFAVQTLAYGLMIRFRKSHNSVGEFIAGTYCSLVP
jgi:hypothetical protein